MKNYNEMNCTEQKELAELLENWLCKYTDEVVLRVMRNIDEVYTNDFAMNLLKELKIREDEEKQDRIRSMKSMLYETFDKDEQVADTHCFHNHCLTHADSYRDVLYDMFIKREK